MGEDTSPKLKSSVTFSALRKKVRDAGVVTVEDFVALTLLCEEATDTANDVGQQFDQRQTTIDAVVQRIIAALESI
jgi:hypothetical protein